MIWLTSLDLAVTIVFSKTSIVKASPALCFSHFCMQLKPDPTEANKPAINPNGQTAFLQKTGLLLKPSPTRVYHLTSLCRPYLFVTRWVGAGSTLPSRPNGKGENWPIRTRPTSFTIQGLCKLIGQAGETPPFFPPQWFSQDSH